MYSARALYHYLLIIKFRHSYHFQFTDILRYRLDNTESDIDSLQKTYMPLFTFVPRTDFGSTQFPTHLNGKVKRQEVTISYLLHLVPKVPKYYSYTYIVPCFIVGFGVKLSFFLVLYNCMKN